MKKSMGILDSVFKNIYKYKCGKVFYLFIIIFVIFGVISNVVYYKNPLNNRNNYEIGYGVINDCIENGKILQYEYTISDGTTLTGESISGYDKFETGDKITVCYLTDNPEISKITGQDNDKLYVALAAIGGIFGTVGFYAALGVLFADIEVRKRSTL